MIVSLFQKVRFPIQRFLYTAFFLLLFGLVACTTTSQHSPKPVVSLKPITLDNSVKLVKGQTIYVPIYSQIYMWEERRTMDLTATLSVRNTDLTRPIILTAVKYHDSQGQLIRNYIEQPAELNALASASFVVNQEDNSGGAGANFIVEWAAQTEVSDPVIESIMINTSGNQGISFVSPGRVIKNRK